MSPTWYDRILLIILILIQGWFIWRGCEAESAQKELRNYFSRRVDSLETLITKKDARIDSLFVKLDSLQENKPEFQLPEHYETMTMPEFIKYLNERYQGYR